MLTDDVENTMPESLMLGMWALFALIDEGKVQEAAKVAQSLLEKDPEDPWVNILAGSVMFSLGDYATARKHMEAAIPRPLERSFRALCCDVNV